MSNEAFRELIWEKGRQLYRDMPWRQNTSPYYVLVSELMLQQTQVERVKSKFAMFMERFPTIETLAAAPLAEVLSLWNGLGYNRRAKFLHEAAKMVVREFNGVFPQAVTELVRLPGVGNNTAGALSVYAFNQPQVFVETNIRTVYFYHFFPNDTAVDDHEIREKLKQTMDYEHPREWYWALMDYGTYLKSQGIRNNATSRQYVKQSPLAGSVREVRGQIVRALTTADHSLEHLKRHVTVDERFEVALEGLIKDGLVMQTDDYFHLTK